MHDVGLPKGSSRDQTMMAAIQMGTKLI